MGIMDTMCDGCALMPKRKVWRPAGYGFLYCGDILCVDHCRYFYFKKKISRCRPAIQSIWLPVLPVIYILMGIIFCTLLIIIQTAFTWPGLIIALIGIPLYYLAVRNKKSTDYNNPVVMISALCNEIFDKSINDYHLTDNVDAAIT